jgi:hypothetical protein
MPGNKHLTRKGATSKDQRQYEHILESEKASGKPTAEAKRIAAATTNQTITTRRAKRKH